MQAIRTAKIKPGWGYWDTTVYPYGGDFRRGKEPIPVTLTEYLGGKYGWRVDLADGRTGVVQQDGLMEVSDAS
jgi:hypothetical protein